MHSGRLIFSPHIADAGNFPYTEKTPEIRPKRQGKNTLPSDYGVTFGVTFHELPQKTPPNPPIFPPFFETSYPKTD
nr:MAG TPA: hypothetical protein [Caudoviricetes sp.]